MWQLYLLSHTDLLRQACPSIARISADVIKIEEVQRGDDTSECISSLLLQPRLTSLLTL